MLRTRLRESGAAGGLGGAGSQSVAADRPAGEAKNRTVPGRLRLREFRRKTSTRLIWRTGR